MRRQPPIVRCFVALCFSSAVALAAFEWRNPFPDPVVTPNALPHVDSETRLVVEDKPTVEHGSASQDLAEPRAGFFARLFGAEDSSGASADESSVQLLLNLETRSLEVREANQPAVFYEVAVGQADWQTPVGKFRVINKIENPAWQHPITKEEIEPGPDNPLGTHWIGFWSDGQAQIGFHGTNQEDLIGEAVSHGCVRMRNQDIQALYQRVDVDTTVTVVSGAAVKRQASSDTQP
jgi:L,D-transpeptidase ErfK/SrfK